MNKKSGCMLKKIKFIPRSKTPVLSLLHLAVDDIQKKMSSVAYVLLKPKLLLTTGMIKCNNKKNIKIILTSSLWAYSMNIFQLETISSKAILSII